MVGLINVQNGLVVIVGGMLNNVSGKLLLNMELSVVSGMFVNDGGQIGVSMNVMIYMGLMMNQGGLIVGLNLLVIVNLMLDNSGGKFEVNQFVLVVVNFVNYGGMIMQYGLLVMGMNVSGMFDNLVVGVIQINVMDLMFMLVELNNVGGIIMYVGIGMLMIVLGNGVSVLNNVLGIFVMKG